MPRIRPNEWSRAGRVARLGRSFASRQGATWTTIALLLVGLLRVVPALRAKSRTATTTLVLQVAEASQLEVQNDSAIVKLRLAPGVAVSLWGDKACTTPADESYIITASGTYTIPLNQIKPGQKGAGDEEGSICLLSSDGVLRRSLPVTGAASLTGTMTSAGKSSPQPAWSGRVSIPAARVSSTETPH